MMFSGKAESGKILQFHRAAAHPQTVASIERNGYASDIFHNPSLRPLTWHFIITRLGDAEILYWGQESSLERARHASSAMLNAMTAEANAI
jgi:hypothetical protein